MSDTAKVAHQARRAGVKADRKREKEKSKRLMGVKADPNRPKNLKAFTFSNIVAAQRDRIRRAEMEAKKMHNFLDRKDIVTRPPPVVVAVAGPPKSGKSTVIKCLVKHFTRAPAFDCVGPVTVTVGRDKRVTFIEVPNDMGAMIDSAKIADLVILTLDGSFGFELETFEYLNILKTHGFPRVLGVLTHMDHFRSNASLSSVKKRMKKRFWQEVCDGAKLYHMSGMINGRYPHREILNLGRYVSSIKARPQAFRNDHSYLVADRVEDLTHPGLLKDTPQCDRTVALYGYVRGTAMKPGVNVHLLGVGDFQVKDLEKIDDPLPLLSHYNDKSSAESLEKRRSLKKQDKRIHAPFSAIGSVLYDKDAVYIKMSSHKVRVSHQDDLILSKRKGDTFNKTAADEEHERKVFEDKTREIYRRLNTVTENEEYVKHLQQQHNNKTIDQALKEDYKISLFKDSKSVTALQFEALRKQREGIDEFPDDLEKEPEDSDDNASGAASGVENDEEDELLAGAKQSENVYDRMTVEEFTDASGRIRRRVIFDGESDVRSYGQDVSNNNAQDDVDDDGYGDNDDDDDFDIDVEDLHDDDTGYYDDDDDDADDNEDEDDADESEESHSDLPSDAPDDHSEGLSYEEETIDEDAHSRGVYDDDDVVQLSSHRPSAPSASTSFYSRSGNLKSQNTSLTDLIYSRGALSVDMDDTSIAGPTAVAGSNTSVNTPSGDADTNDNDDDDDDDDFFVMRHKVGTLGKRHQRESNHQPIFAKSTHDLAHQSSGKMAKSLAFLDPSVFHLDEQHDSSFVAYSGENTHHYRDDSVREGLRNRFVTGDWLKANETLNAAAGDDDDDEDDEGADDDSDSDPRNITKSTPKNPLGLSKDEIKRRKALGIPLDHNQDWETAGFGKGTKRRPPKAGQSDSFVDENDDFQSMVRDEVLFGDFEEVGSDDNDMDDVDDDGDAAVRKRLEMKLKQKQGFLAELEQEAKADEDESEQTKNGKKMKLSKAILQEQYDYFQAKRDELMKKIKERDEMMQELSEDEQLTLFGAIPGTYVRIVLSEVPCEFIDYFNPTYPIVLGALQPTEQNLGFINLRVKKHRWHHRLLKSNDPLIFSVGWRRFQSLPIFYVEDVTGRQRYLKYTPEHLHCLASMYAPMTAINTGVIAFKNVYLASKSIDPTKTVSHFRVALTGVVLEVDKKVEVKKKLKLIGYPLQIFKKTAYIQGMFNSSIEVAKFENSRIQTVSGIQGRIVKAVTHEGKEGVYRANFNDRILKSDVVILKTFTVVKLYKYYNPVTSLLLRDKTTWKGMRTHKELRADNKTPIVHTSDNQYKDIQRSVRKFNSLRVPTSLAQALPFKTLDKTTSISKKDKEKTDYQKKRTLFLDKRDTRKESFVDTVQHVAVHREKRRKESEASRDKRRFNETRENARKLQQMKKDLKKKRFIAMGKRHAENH